MSSASIPHRRSRTFYHKKRKARFNVGSVFSDEECEGMNITPSAVSPSRSYSVPASNNMDYPEEPPMELKKPREQTQFSPPANFSPSVDDNEDVEQELDMFNKAIHISNIDEIDHVGLMRGMHERFQRKQLKWQHYASSYSKWAFGINFLILVMQIVQMLFHQLVEVFSSDPNSSPDPDNPGKYSFPRMGFYRRYGLPVPDMSALPLIVFNASTLQAIRCVLSAVTAALAGLQMKLKLTEKAEKYRRGAKVYARLHRLSTYYLMLAENGGKVEDVTGLWREAMKKEGKWIPVVKTFMAT